MSEKELISIMDGIYNAEKGKPLSKKTILKCVELGMKYRESQFIDGWKIMLDTIHGKNK